MIGTYKKIMRNMIDYEKQYSDNKEEKDDQNVFQDDYNIKNLVLFSEI